MSQRMTGCFKDTNLMAAKAELVSLGHALVDARNAVRFLLRPDHDAAGLVLQRSMARRMVSVMMRRENMGQRPASFGERAANGCGVGRVDGGRDAEFIVVDKDAEIVAAAEKLVNLQLRHRIFSLSRDHRPV